MTPDRTRQECVVHGRSTHWPLHGWAVMLGATVKPVCAEKEDFDE